MTHSTSRLALNIPDTTDAVNAFPGGPITQALGVLDAAMTITTGTVSARPAAGTYGKAYYATDTTTFYFDTGTTWETVLSASAWQNLSLAGSIVSAGAYTPSARAEGDLVRLKGQIQNTGSTKSAGATLATIPAGLRPSSALTIVAAGTLSGALISVVLTLPTNGQINISNSSFTTSSVVAFDGVTYSLN